jgi:hypothetical protein
MPKPSTATLAEPVIEMRAPPAGSERPRVLRAVKAGLLVVAAIFAALHFVHLKADFPNHSFWKDWAKFTDEGWYSSAAIRLYQLGHWNLPGDFNPAAALPVWPAIEVVLFRFTGVSLVALRVLSVVVFCMTLVGCYFLLRRWMGQASLVPAVTVLLLAVSPFYFAFTRIVILEPPLILLMVVALLVASAAGGAVGRARVAWVVVLGLLLPVMVLTKTTAVFLFPAILWMLWAASSYRLRAFLRAAVPAAILGAAVWGAYYGLLARSRYLVDYRYLFAANAYTAFSWQGLPTLLFNTLFDGIWIGKTLFALALVAMIGAVVGFFAKGLRANPMQVTMLLWVAGYGAFLAYHANLQPRYYLVLAVPLTALVVMVLEPLFVGAARTWARDAASGGTVDVFLLRATAAIAGGALLFAGVNAGRQTLGFVLHPEYSWVSAVAQIGDVVEREAARTGHSKMVLSISGANLSLMAGLPSICDDFGTMSVSQRVMAYKPGWFATWNAVEDDKMESLAPMYRLQRVLAVPAFDDPDRNLLILYRLDALATPGPPPAPRPRRNMFVPKSLRKKFAEQPSAEQSQH